MPRDTVWNSIACNPQCYKNATEGLQTDAFIYYNLLLFLPGEYLLHTVTFLTALGLPWRDKVSNGFCYRAATLVLAARCDRKLICRKKQRETSVSVCSET